MNLLLEFLLSFVPTLKSDLEMLLANNTKMKIEYDYSCYDCLPNLEKEGEKMYRPKKVGNMVPMMYSLVLEKK